MTNTRLYQLDILKAIGIILVIIGHTYVNSFMCNFIYSFHMPLFFMVSGYFFKEKANSIHIIRNNFYRLILPYLLTCLIILLINEVMKIISLNTPFSSLFTWIKSSLLGIGTTTNPNLYSVGPIWFLPALFWATVLFHLIIKYRKYCIPSIAIISSVILALYLAKKQIYLPFCIQQGALGILFLYIGYLVRQYHPSITITSVFSLLLMASVWLMSIKSGFLSILQCYASPEIITLSGAIAGSYFSYLLASYLNRKTNLIRKVLIKTGQATLLILCIHTIDNIFIPYNQLIDKIGGGINIVYIILLRVIITIFIALAISKIPPIKKVFNII